MKDEDLSVFFDEHFGSSVSALGRTEEYGGILDSPQEYVGPDGQVMVTDYELFVRTDFFGDLREGDVVDVDGERYRVRRDARRRDDGATSVVALQKVRNVVYSE